VSDPTVLMEPLKLPGPPSGRGPGPTQPRRAGPDAGRGSADVLPVADAWATVQRASDPNVSGQYVSGSPRRALRSFPSAAPRRLIGRPEVDVLVRFPLDSSRFLQGPPIRASLWVSGWFR
jgi:hypothetical protein